MRVSELEGYERAWLGTYLKKGGCGVKRTGGKCRHRAHKGCLMT